MGAETKLLIGVIIFLAGIYWYVAPLLGHSGIAGILGVSAFRSLVTVFAGTFGLFLVFLGLIVAWIEYEDLKWEAREKKEIRNKRRRKR